MSEPSDDTAEAALCAISEPGRADATVRVGCEGADGREAASRDRAERPPADRGVSG